MASILKGQSGQPIQFETVPNVNGDDVAVMANVGPVTNFDSATGTVTIPSGLEIGTRRLIRKIHPTQGTVTINCSGETFTRAGLASVELNADGDYWLLEKVTATRWELVDGWNTGENANGVWRMYANGVQECNVRRGNNLSNGTLRGGVYVSEQTSLPLPKDFIGSSESIFAACGHIDSPQNNGWWVNARVSAQQWVVQAYRNSSFSTGNVGEYELSATGRWYL